MMAAVPASANEGAQAVASLNVQLAAAEAPGDLVSDAALFKLFPVVLGFQPDPDSLDPALRSRVMAAQMALGERVAGGLATDPTVLALELRCPPAAKASQACEARMDRLSGLAGDNAYHHVVLMGTATALGDHGAVLEHARRAARAPDYHHDIATVFSSLYARYSQVPESMWQALRAPEGQRRSPGVEAMAYAAAVALPHYKYIFDACRDPAGELRRHCLDIGRKMTHGSGVLLDIEVGAKIVAKLGGEDDQAKARQKLREARWLGRAVATPEDSLDAAQWDEFFAIYAREGELAAMRYAATAQGIALVPPTGWTGEPEVRPTS
ncbi:hypothetical protein N788_04715 [Arenimonas donghaensis DSM 18148 = HO3-R19]|uniref:Uncharacterized protein n=2 Tax=Arenimonas TaxID=490567 RepID=A0A087MH41_9GAMM|nr:hypothetical protein N788_04715 [Arenimonas donghaensis DSM 18148 = HO3-R19]